MRVIHPKYNKLNILKDWETILLEIVRFEGWIAETKASEEYHDR